MAMSQKEERGFSADFRRSAGTWHGLRGETDDIRSKDKKILAECNTAEKKEKTCWKVQEGRTDQRAHNQTKARTLAHKEGERALPVWGTLK